MMRGKHSWLIMLCIVILSAGSTLAGPGTYAKQIQAFEEWVVEQMARDRIPGLSIGFMKDDFIWAEGFGYADLENRLEATASSAYRLASNTKSMAAAAVLQLYEQGKLDLDAEVQRFVPYFPRKEWPVTIRPLLGHLGGIDHYRNYDVEGHIKEPRDTRQALAIFQDFELVAEPWTRYRYSSYGYNLLGAVVEGAARMPFGEYMREHVWGPLGMDETCMDDPTERIPNRVRGYRLIDGEVKNSEYLDISSRFAGGGTRSTVVDLLTYVKGYWEGTLLQPETIDLMWTSMATRDGRYTDYGMGWRVAPVNGRHTVSHTGAQAETRTFLMHFPAERFAIALAYNFEGANGTDYARRLFELILGEPWELRPYAEDENDRILLAGLYDAFEYGLARFEKRGSSIGGVEEAFLYFNACMNKGALKKNPAETRKRIRDGRHPAAQDAFVKVGSTVAALLTGKHGREGLAVYHRNGAIRFFADYVSAYREDTEFPEGLRFSEELEDLLTRWDEDWRACFEEAVGVFPLTPETDLKRMGNRWERLFAGKDLHPDFHSDLAKVLTYDLLEGEDAEAFEVADLVVRLYPEASFAHAMLGHARACYGSAESALDAYQRAMEMNPREPLLSAGRIRGLAGLLAVHGRTDEAMRLIKAGMQLDPEDAGLYTRQAEFLLEGAQDYLRKALQVNPNYDPAYNMLKKIE